MRKITVIQQFSLLCFGALVIFAIAFNWIISSSLEHNMLMRSQKTVAKIVSDEVLKTFAGLDLITPKINADFNVFAEKVKQLSLGPDIERIKIYNKDRVIVWSDEKLLVGQSFPDNEELDEAFGGKVTSELSTLEKTENKFERQFKRLLELYVPIRFNDSKNIDTVIEIYQNLDPLYKDISSQKQLIWISIILGFSLLYALLFGIVWRASRQIEKQTQKIMQSEESYRNLVQSALDAIISIDSNGKVILFNKAAEQMFGYTAKEVIGQDPTILIPEQYKAKHITGMSRFFESGKTKIIGRTSEMEGMRKDGRSFSIELSLSTSEGEDGQTVTGIFRDISERKAIQSQLIEMERQTSISTIAGGIGHEINNVIGGLMGYADLLKMEPHDSQLAQKSAEIFTAQSQRLKLHAHNLLSLSRPREPQMQPIDLNGLIEKVTELLCASGLLKMCTIIREYSKDIPEVSGDEMLLEQLLRNLEINAAHAMNNQGILTLRTKISESKSSVEFSITDTGHGIPDDKRGQIFLPFFTTKEKGKGTGLGMYIVKQVVDQHKGYIHLDSKVGIGTTITIGLPVKRE